MSSKKISELTAISTLEGTDEIPIVDDSANETKKLTYTLLQSNIASDTVSDTAYDDTTWDGITDKAPSKNAVRDYIHDRITKAPEISLSSVNSDGGFISKIDNATGDIARTTSGWIEDEDYGIYFYRSTTAVSGEFDSDIKRTGDFTLKLSTTDITGRCIGATSNISAPTTRKDFIKLKASTNYKFRIWVKTENVATDSVYVVVRTSDYTSGNSQLITSDKLSGDHDWVLLEKTFTTNASAEACSIRFYNDIAGNISSAWFDINSLELKEVIEVENTNDNVFSGITSIKGETTNTIIDQYYSQDDLTLNFGTTTLDAVGQQFTPESVKLSQISVNLKTIGTPTDNLFLNLYDLSTDLPDTLLSSYSIAVDSLSSTMAEYTLPLPYELDDLSKVAFTLEREGSASDTNYFATSNSASSLYARGDQLEYASATWTENTSNDIYFKTHFAKKTENPKATINGITTQTTGEILNGATYDIVNGKYTFQEDFEFGTSKWFDNLYSIDNGGYTANSTDSLLTNGWKQSSNNSGRIGANVDTSERALTWEICAKFPISNLKVYAGLFSPKDKGITIQISNDNLNWTEFILNSEATEESKVETNLFDGQSRVFIKVAKDTTNAYFSIYNFRVECDIDTHSVSTGKIYPTGRDNAFALGVQLSSNVDRVYYRKNKYGASAFEFQATTDSKGFVYLPIDTSLDDSETITITNAQGTADGTELEDGDYISFTSSDIVYLDYTINISKNFLELGAGGGQGIFSYVGLTQGMKYDVINLQKEVQTLKENGKNRAYVFGSLESETATTITTAGTWYAVEGVFNNLPMKNFILDTDKIKYIGEKTGYFIINWDSCGKVDTNGTTFSTTIKLNDEVQSDFKMCTFGKTADELFVNGGNMILKLEKNDTIQIVSTNDNSGDDITFSNFNISINSLDF